MLPLFAILAGAGVGAANAIVGHQVPTMELAGRTTGDSKPVVAAGDRLSARATLPNGNEHDFGIMARGDSMSHSFQVRNIGGGPLTLDVVNTTCKCTVGELEKNKIESGEIVDVTLTWEAKSYDREFRQSATIETNDRVLREIVFSVYGKVVQLAIPQIPVTSFNRVSRGEQRSFNTPIYGYRDDDLQITKHEFFNEELSEFFDVKVVPLPKEEWTDPEATSGLLCTVDIKPGLPVGAIRQGIKLHTNKEDIPPLELTVDMNIVSDIAVIGPNFYSEKNLLVWGAPAKSEVDSRKKLFLIVKGDHKDVVDFSVAEADPNGVLTAEFGEPTDVRRDGQLIARRFPMDIVIRKGNAGVQRMGTLQSPVGVLLLHTNHPEIEELKIRVKFSVE